MIVVDSSALVAALVSQPRVPRLRERLEADGDLHAPHLIDVEVAHALRRLARKAALTASQAELVRADAPALAIRRYPHVGLLDRAWELRENLTAYDAVYVALSEALGVPLVTLDARLARAAGDVTRIELYAH